MRYGKLEDGAMHFYKAKGVARAVEEEPIAIAAE